MGSNNLLMGGQDFTIKEFIKHEAFDINTNKNDIAVAKLSRDVDFDRQTLRPACLWQSAQLNENKTIAIGYGYTSNSRRTTDVLLKVQLDILDNSDCVKSHGSDVSKGELMKNSLAIVEVNFIFVMLYSTYHMRWCFSWWPRQ